MRRPTPKAPERIETFDPHMRDPQGTSWPHRGPHGWLTRHSLQHGYRERWMSGLWDLHLYEHPGRAKLWCVGAFRDGVEKSTTGRSYGPAAGHIVDHDYETLTDARQAFADWARHAAIDTACEVLNLV